MVSPKVTNNLSQFVLESIKTWMWTRSDTTLTSPPDDRSYGTLRLFRDKTKRVIAAHITIQSPSSDWASSHLLCYRSDGSLEASGDQLAAFGMPHGGGLFTREKTYDAQGKSPNDTLCRLRYDGEDTEPTEYPCDSPDFNLGNFASTRVDRINHLMFSNVGQLASLLAKHNH